MLALRELAELLALHRLLQPVKLVMSLELSFRHIQLQQPVPQLQYELLNMQWLQHHLHLLQRFAHIAGQRLRSQLQQPFECSDRGHN